MTEKAGQQPCHSYLLKTKPSEVEMREKKPVLSFDIFRVNMTIFLKLTKLRP